MKEARWQEVSQLYFQALDLPESKRDAFLRTCKDEELRQEVLSLLADETLARSFLERPALEMAPGSEMKKKPSLIGRQFGSYHVVSELGRGGMGEVYRAKDQKLGRDVAIKVLPEEFARDADRVARFQREAKLLASLNHTNIAAIYGLETSDGTNFLVLELVEGETLAEQLMRGPIPVEESLKLALQIAEALEAAHEKGVIHRDLKPTNIKVTPEGKVKVLDFGLAKAFAGDQEEVNLSNSPTLSNTATQQGVILGTAAYMSPEQARGKPVDKRADIWAFGCVLFEMLTGRVAFPGKDVTDILAAVIRSQPEWNALPQTLHWRLREVLERCLEKEARNRYSGIGDARVGIQKVLADPSGVLVPPVMAVKPKGKLRLGMPWIAAIIVLIAVLAGVAVWNLKPLEPRQIVRFEYELPDDQQFSTLTRSPLAVSPDGKQIVYSTARGLYIRSVKELAAKFIPGTEGNNQQPFFSSDGKWIGYYSAADGKLKKIVVNGGGSVSLCDVSGLIGANWNEDNTIVYCLLLGDIMRISANGGTPESLVTKKIMPAIFSYPQILPDGKSVLYTASATGSATRRWRIVVKPLKSGEPKVLFAGVDGRYLPTGHIVYKLPNNDNLFAIHFDIDRLDVTGEPATIVQGVQQYAVSDSGTLAYIPGVTAAASANQRTFVWVDRKGKETALAAEPNDYHNPKISPDGTQVALRKMTGDKSDIWILDLIRGTMSPLTFNESSDWPLWTRDGKRIVFMSASGGEKEMFGNVFWKAADGTGAEEKLGSAPVAATFLHPFSWSSDGEILALAELGQGSGGLYDIGILPMEGNRKYKPLLKEKYIENCPQISPDGRWMAYQSDESGKMEIYVRPFPEVDKEGKCQVSVAGGEAPLWSRDGRELFYRNGDSVIAVSLQTEPVFRPGKLEVLFQGKYVPSSIGNGYMWDVHPDGKRFLMMKEAALAGKPAATSESRKIVIVLNWLEELKQRVPRK